MSTKMIKYDHDLRDSNSNMNQVLNERLLVNTLTTINIYISAYNVLIHWS